MKTYEDYMCNQPMRDGEEIRSFLDDDRIRLFNIEWDTDGEIVDLPTEVIIENPTEEMLDAVGGFDDVFADYLSDKYGFCVFGFRADYC